VEGQPGLHHADREVGSVRLAEHECMRVVARRRQPFEEDRDGGIRVDGRVDSFLVQHELKMRGRPSGHLERHRPPVGDRDGFAEQRLKIRQFDIQTEPSDWLGDGVPPDHRKRAEGSGGLGRRGQFVNEIVEGKPGRERQREAKR